MGSPAQKVVCLWQEGLSSQINPDTFYTVEMNVYLSGITEMNVSSRSASPNIKPDKLLTLWSEGFLDIIHDTTYSKFQELKQSDLY